MQNVRFVKAIDFDLLKSDGQTSNAIFGFGEWHQVKQVQATALGYDITFLNGDFLEACPVEVVELHNCQLIPYVEPPTFNRGTPEKDIAYQKEVQEYTEKTKDDTKK